MINVSDNFKQAMKKPVKTITASLVLDDNTVITGQDKLIKITIDSSGHLFGTATSVVNVELFGTDYNLVDHTFSVIAKTLVDIENDTWEEANLGMFYIDESTADFEKKTTKIKGYDLMGKLAKTPYNSGTIQFPCTVKELINQLAERFEFTVGTNLDNLPNTTYQIPEDLYAKISNCTYRDILGEIAGATATIAVFNGKTLSFRYSKKKPDEDEIWTYDNLKTLKYKPKYGPVNSLVLARTPQEDNIAVSDNDSITANGLTEVKLANNEILDDDRRKLITPIFDSIKDFSHHPFEAETTGLGWYKPGDLVSAQAGGGLMNGKTIGWLSQKITTGKNAIDYSAKNIGAWQCTAESYGNGVKITAKAFSGVAYVAKVIPNSASFLGKTITVSAKTSGSVTQCAIYALRGTATYERLATLPASGGSYKFPDNFPADRDGFGILFYVSQNSTSTVIDVQVELGNTATDYEPYTGGFNNLFDEFSGLPVNKNGVSLINLDGDLRLSGTPDRDWIQLVSRDITGILTNNRPYTIVQYNTPNTKFYVEISARKKDGSGYDVIGNKTTKTHNFTANLTLYDRYTMMIMCGRQDDATPLPLFGNFGLYYGTFNENNLPEYSPYSTGLVSPRPQLPQKIKETNNRATVITSDNLLISATETISNGVTHTPQADGSIKSAGTMTANWTTLPFRFFNLEPGKYTLNRDGGYKYNVSIDSNTGGNHVIAVAYNQNGNFSFVVTKPETNAYIVYSCPKGTVIGTTTKFSLGKSSECVIMNGRNLLQITDSPMSGSNGVISIISPDGSISFSGTKTQTWADVTRFKVFANILPAGKYTFSINNPLPYNVVFKFCDPNYKYSEARITPGATATTFNTKTDIYAGYIYVSNAATSSEISGSFKAQLEAGDVATEIVSYEEQNFTLPENENLYKLNDTIYDEVKLENGVAKLIKRVGKLEFSGDEEKITHYYTTKAGTIGFKYKNPSGEMIFTQQNSTASIICSHFNAINEDAVYTTRENRTGVAIYGGYNNFPKYASTMGFWFTAPDALNLGITNVDSFKNWLKSEKAKGTPVTIYYEMKEPQITELGRTNLNQVYITDTHLELGNGIKETIKGVAPTATQTDYARAGGITKTIYNTEIKVDKQKQEIESIVSKQTQVDQQIADEFSKITQNIKNVVTTIQTTGGGNLIKNSVGYAKNQDGTLVEWTKNSTGEVKSYTSPESKSYGAISGNAIELKRGASITQRLNVASSGKIPYTLSFRCKKGAIGTATVKLSNTIDSFVITIPEGKEIVWQNYDLTKLDPSMNYLDVNVSTSSNCEQFLITDLMVNMGDQSIPWVQANGEILNTQVAVNDQGMMISSSVYSGDYVQITPLGMSGHSNVTGIDEEVFKLNRDVTETSKLSVRKEISMDPIKIIPVKDGDMAGWNFVG